MNVYLVRHGESEGNKQEIYQTQEVPLSSRGKRQAELIAKRLKDKNIDIIYTSPYLRARQTAEIIAQRLNLKVKCWDSLREKKRPSELDGLRYSDPKARKIKKIILANQLNGDWKFSDEESFNELLARARQVGRNLVKQNDGENVLCVSHVKIIFMIVLSLIFQEKLTPEVFWPFYYHSQLANTGIIHLKYTKNLGWSLVTWNDINHL